MLGGKRRSSHASEQDWAQDWIGWICLDVPKTQQANGAVARLRLCPLRPTLTLTTAQKNFILYIQYTPGTHNR